jgi:hydroxyacylglutathione hydrolase
VEAIVDRLGAIPVLGSEHDLSEKRIPKQTRGLADGERFAFGAYEVSIRAVPGHTLGAITYVVDGWAFTGDTLFVAGCGRVFEGTMAQMAEAMRILRSLPASTKIACGHEYTVRNLEFAQTIEPDSGAIAEALREARATRESGAPTVPSTMARELETNPFLRFDLEPIRGDHAPVASFEAIRRAKDAF